MAWTTEQVKAAIIEIAKVIGDNKQYLSELDQAIGDGDHGHNMARGFEAAVKKLEESAPAAPGDALKSTAAALISNVGGASGPLYGTLFLRAGGAVKGAELDLAGFAAALKEGIAGVQARGKAVLGEKTMLDVLIPASESLEKDAAAGTSCKEALEKAAKLGRQCAEKTAGIKATKGRASYLGERSIGHIDPGAMSSCLILETVARLCA